MRVTMIMTIGQTSCHFPVGRPFRHWQPGTGSWPQVSPMDGVAVSVDAARHDDTVRGISQNFGFVPNEDKTIFYIPSQSIFPQR